MLKKIVLLLITALMACASLNLGAQTARRIPANAKPAVFTTATYPWVTLDDTQYRLSPGARIFLPNNTTILPHAAPKQVAAKYLLDAHGMVQTIWILTPREQTPN